MINDCLVSSDYRLVTLATNVRDTVGGLVALGTVVSRVRPGADGHDVYRVDGTSRQVVATGDQIRVLGVGVRAVIAYHTDGYDVVITDSQMHPGGFGGCRELCDAMQRAAMVLPGMLTVDMWTVGGTPERIVG